MNSRMTRLMTVSACVAVLGLGVAQVKAQGAAFDLPCNAKWGGTVLPAGHYTFEAPDPLSYTPIFYLRGSDGTRLAVPHIVGTEPASGHSYLKLENVDGTYYVQEFTSGARAMSLQFAIPKATHGDIHHHHTLVARISN